MYIEGVRYVHGLRRKNRGFGDVQSVILRFIGNPGDKARVYEGGRTCVQTKRRRICDYCLYCSVIYLVGRGRRLKKRGESVHLSFSLPRGQERLQAINVNVKDGRADKERENTPLSDSRLILFVQSSYLQYAYAHACMHIYVTKTRERGRERKRQKSERASLYGRNERARGEEKERPRRERRKKIIARSCALLYTPYSWPFFVTNATGTFYIRHYESPLYTRTHTRASLGCLMNSSSPLCHIAV